MAFRSHKLTKYVTEYQIHGNYGYGWDKECATRDYSEMISDYRAYLSNGGGRYKIIHKQIPNPDHARFTVGQRVRTHPGTSAWMGGFQVGDITKVGRKYVTVAWAFNPSVTRRFYPQHIEPLDE